MSTRTDSASVVFLPSVNMVQYVLLFQIVSSILSVQQEHISEPLE
jgi:hypothetical protein